MQDANPLLDAHAKIMLVDIDLIKGGKTVGYYNTVARRWASRLAPRPMATHCSPSKIGYKLAARAL